MLSPQLPTGFIACTCTRLYSVVRSHDCHWYLAYTGSRCQMSEYQTTHSVFVADIVDKCNISLNNFLKITDLQLLNLRG